MDELLVFVGTAISELRELDQVVELGVVDVVDQCPGRDSNPHATRAGLFESPESAVPPPGRARTS
jgi:hypothetical protein